ncbi:MAG: DNA alkylation repair protein [Candidatus Cloacimonadota bacterium]|nr:MAG: DNA alkylation repair protein [Candidatus Cloacimonadota bacterium]
MFFDKMRKELKRNADKEYKKSIKRFFKEGQEINLIGVRTPVVRGISKKYFSQINSKSKKEILNLCEELLKNGYSEEQGIAFGWAARLKDDFSPTDFNRFRSWLKKYVKNWGHCDGYCFGVLGPFIYAFPQYIPEIKKWTGSKNRWFRRASAVLVIYLLKDKKYLKTAFNIADRLLLDEDDLVQKGYGWLLKEASNRYQKEVFDYVIKHKAEMPRTALRYAIEKMPKELKKKAMAK